MWSRLANRRNPLMRAYYQSLADVIGIFWQFHNDRVERGNIPFAAVLEYRGANLPDIIPFSPEHHLAVHGNVTRQFTFKPIERFTASVYTTMNASYQQFLAGNGIAANHTDFLEDTPIPQETQRFFHPFVTNKINEAARLFAYVYPESNKKFLDNPDSDIPDETSRLFNVRMKQGFNTGTGVALQLDSLFGENFETKLAVAISKTSIQYNDDVLTGIGIWGREKTYTLLDNSKLGLDSKQLRGFGRGIVLGCPASMIVSADTQLFLRERGRDVSKLTMLADFSDKLPDRVNLHLRGWFNELSPEQRVEANINPVELAVLTGEARRSTLAQKEGPRCPYGKEK